MANAPFRSFFSADFLKNYERLMEYTQIADFLERIERGAAAEYSAHRLRCDRSEAFQLAVKLGCLREVRDLLGGRGKLDPMKDVSDLNAGLKWMDESDDSGAIITAIKDHADMHSLQLDFTAAILFKEATGHRKIASQLREAAQRPVQKTELNLQGLAR